MPRTHLTPDPAFANRLRIAIDETGMTHHEFARRYELTGKSISRYVTAERVPDARANQKLANALRERYLWVLTGEEPSEIAQRTVGSFPPPLRMLIEVATTLPAHLQETLTTCATFFARGDHLPSVKTLADTIRSWFALSQMGTELLPDEPITPDESPPGN